MRYAHVIRSIANMVVVLMVTIFRDHDDDGANVVDDDVDEDGNGDHDNDDDGDDN